MERADFIAANSLTEHIRREGIKLRRSGQELATNRCPAATHKEDHLCVNVNEREQIFHCHDCKVGGSIIDWLMLETGQTASEVLSAATTPPTAKQQSGANLDAGNANVEAVYDYTDERGNLRYQVVRYRPKTFRQRRPDGKGGWLWELEGVVRVLFKLPAVIASQTVFICEGEKDCNALVTLGYAATTNAGGAGKWLSAYSEYLKGKDVVILPDQDAPGKKHAELILESLADKANSVKIVDLPAKDPAEFIAGFQTTDVAKLELQKLVDGAPHALKPLPIYTITEMEEHYKKFVNSMSSRALYLGKAMPALRSLVPLPLFPGELVLILGDTGVGKSAVAQTIARGAAPLATLFFELELPLDAMYVRFVQMEMNCTHEEVYGDYRSDPNASYATNFHGLRHILTCPESGLTSERIESYIGRSELKFGKPPALVIVDYVGLMKAQGARSRYENTSAAAEALKVIAKRTETVVVVASQVSRPDKEKRSTPEVRLHDAKDSGSLENSAGLVIGCWRADQDRMTLKILKNTKGKSGDTVEVPFDGAKMRIG